MHQQVRFTRQALIDIATYSLDASKCHAIKKRSNDSQLDQMKNETGTREIKIHDSKHFFTQCNFELQAKNKDRCSRLGAIINAMEM